MSEPADVDIRVWLTASQYSALVILADRDERPISNYVRMLIRNHIRQESDRLAALRRDDEGLIPDGKRTKTDA